MRLLRPVAWALLGVGLLVGAPSPSRAEPPSRVRLGKVHRLRVTHTTRVTVEAGLARLRVWQAQPRARTWPGSEAPWVPQAATFSPTAATERPTKAEGGLAWVWDLPQPEAGSLALVSRFEVLSADRDLDTAGLTIRWKELEAGAGEAPEAAPDLPEPTPRLLEVHQGLRKKAKDVLEAVVAFTRWIRSHVVHRGGVSYGIRDLDAILAGGAGHCGHRATVFLALCRASGIPARRVVGYSLDGAPGLLDGREDPNRHVWAEVRLPGLGWVEVEPAPTGSPFAIPYTRVMTPADLQSCFVEAVGPGGASRRPPYEDTLAVVEVR